MPRSKFNNLHKQLPRKLCINIYKSTIYTFITTNKMTDQHIETINEETKPTGSQSTKEEDKVKEEKNIENKV